MHWRIDQDGWWNLGDDRTDPILGVRAHHLLCDSVLIRQLHQYLQCETGFPSLFCHQGGVAHDPVVLDELKVIKPSLRDRVVKRPHLVPRPVTDADHHDGEWKE